MIVLRCTHKLLKEIRLPKEGLGDPGEGFLGSWFANLFRLDRRKCVIFTNDRTLYSFILYGQKRPDFDELEERFLTSLAENLLLDGFPAKTVKRIYWTCHPVAFGMTNSRSVLGSMNDLVHLASYMVPLQPLVTDRAIAIVNRELNRTPMRNLKYVYPVKEMAAVLEGWPPEKEREMGPPKIYIELNMSEREKYLVLDSPLHDLGFEGRFKKSSDGKHFAARLNRNEMEDLVDFIASLANHQEDTELERELESYYEKYHNILLSMG